MSAAMVTHDQSVPPHGVVHPCLQAFSLATMVTHDHWSRPLVKSPPTTINNKRVGVVDILHRPTVDHSLAMAASVYSEETRSTTSGGTIPLASQHDRLLIELESAEGQLGAIVRYSFLQRCVSFPLNVYIPSDENVYRYDKC